MSDKMIQRRSIRVIALVALMAGIAYPLIGIYGIYPAFKHRLVADIEEEATRVARHLSESMLSEVPLIFDGSMRAWGEMNAPGMQKQFRIVTLKIFNAEGTITYSTDSFQIDEKNVESYFREIVERGRPFSRLIESGSDMPRLKQMNRDVIEAYLPIMKDDRFIGAFGIDYDVTERKAAMDRIAWYGSVIPLALTCVFLALIFTLLYRLDRDATLRENMKEELRTEQDRYGRLLENLRSEYFVYSMDPGGRMTFVSPGVKNVLRIDAETWLENGYEPYLTEHSVNAEARHRRSGSLSGIEQPTYEMELTDADGNLRILEINEMPVTDGEGNCIAVEGIAHDVTERKKTEAELREHQYQIADKHEALISLFGQVERAKQEWERTMDCFEDMIFLLDGAGRIRRCNRAVVEFTGRLYDEVVGLEWNDFFEREELRIDATGFPPEGEVFHARKKRWLNARSFPYMDPVTDAQDGHVVTLQDITRIRGIRESTDSSERAPQGQERIATLLDSFSGAKDWVSRAINAEGIGRNRKD